ncbi:MAG: hypothetical protein HY247_05070 [archaeon]|nr:MAG: hypothetical protein HY247_05070 [archaeon]
MRPLAALLSIGEKSEPGPSPGFTRAHLLLAFLTIGNSRTIGRQALAQDIGLGEGSIRTVLKKLREEGYVDADTTGCHLTVLGARLYRETLSALSPMISIKDSRLTVGSHHVGMLVRSGARKVATGIDQRDAAILVGAAGATTYVIKEGKFAVPGGSHDCERDFPSGTWSLLRAGLSPKNGDAVVLCGASNDSTARLGALSAALTLL